MKGALLRGSWCVELDLEKFFDRVNHDVLMAYIERQIEDKRVLMLIRRYLEAGMKSGGIASRQQEARRKAARSHRCCRTSCSMNSTASWNGGAIALYAMPTTPIFMCAVVVLASECWSGLSAS
jgi:hypothetical protein